jgi:hypothetical protein
MRFNVVVCDNGPEAAVTVIEKGCGVYVLCWHPANPAARTALARASTARLRQLISGLAQRRPAKGSKKSPSAIGSEPPLKGLCCDCAIVLPGEITASVTFVAAEFAATVAGVNTAVMPEGSPVTLMFTAAGSVEPPTGVITRG